MLEVPNNAELIKIVSWKKGNRRKNLIKSSWRSVKRCGLEKSIEMWISNLDSGASRSLFELPNVAESVTDTVIR